MSLSLREDANEATYMIFSLGEQEHAILTRSSILIVNQVLKDEGRSSMTQNLLLFFPETVLHKMETAMMKTETALQKTKPALQKMEHAMQKTKTKITYFTF